MLHPYQTERSIALQATIAAAQLCEAVRHDQASTAFQKADRSPVTIADYGSQALICRALGAAFPQDAIVAEEDAQILQQLEMADCLAQVTDYVGRYVQQSVQIPGLIVPDTTLDDMLLDEITAAEPLVVDPTAKVTPAQVLQWVGYGGTQTPAELGSRFWTLDPIDGTKGYVRGDQYAIALALIEFGHVQLGLIIAPALPVNFNGTTDDRGVAFVAVRGHGAMQIGLKTGEARSLQVNKSDDARSFRLIQSVEQSHGTPQWQAAVAKAVGITAPSLHMDSLAKYGAIARGEADLSLRLCSATSSVQVENIWDHAAGVVVLQEAGGKVTDQTGKPLNFLNGPKMHTNRGIVASNGGLHEAAIEAIPMNL